MEISGYVLGSGWNLVTTVVQTLGFGFADLEN